MKRSFFLILLIGVLCIPLGLYTGGCATTKVTDPSGAVTETSVVDQDAINLIASLIDQAITLYGNSQGVKSATARSDILASIVKFESMAANHPDKNIRSNALSKAEKFRARLSGIP